jgi:hypothetical protein
VSAGCCSPPDSTGDVGPTHFVEMVNDAVAIYPRSGGMSDSASLESFAGFPTTAHPTRRVSWRQNQP